MMKITEQYIAKLKEKINLQRKEIANPEIIADEDFLNLCRLNNKDIATLEAELAEQKPVNGEYFVKVYIKSEDDLPKENGYYFFKYKESIGGGNGMKNYIKDYDSIIWLDDVDWYLLPVDALPKTEFKPVKRAEIEKQIYDILISHKKFESVTGDWIQVASNHLRVWFEQYASQRTDLREELIKFTLWSYKDYKFKELQRPSIEQVIGEYLKTKQ